jgi:hypothetical protein
MDGSKSTSEPQPRPPTRHLDCPHAVIALLIDLTAQAGGRLTLDAERREELRQQGVSDQALWLALDISDSESLFFGRRLGDGIEIELPAGQGGAA